MPSVFGTLHMSTVAEAITLLYERLASPDGETWLNAFQRFLYMENPWVNFEVWKTIILDAELRTADDFRRTLLSGGFYKDDGVNDMLNNSALDVATSEVKVQLVNISAAELGFSCNIIPLINIYRKAISLGLELCPDNLGPQLRVQYMDQPADEYLHVAMEQIKCASGDFVYTIECDKEGKKGINSFEVNMRSSCLRDSNCRFIFIIPFCQPVPRSMQSGFETRTFRWIS